MIEFSKGITLEEAISKVDEKFNGNASTLGENNRVILGSDQITMFD